jgi:hypothetical protein
VLRIAVFVSVLMLRYCVGVTAVYLDLLIYHLVQMQLVIHTNIFFIILYKFLLLSLRNASRIEFLHVCHIISKTIPPKAEREGPVGSA